MNSIEYQRRSFSWLQEKLRVISQWLAVHLEDSKHKSNIAVLDGVRAIAALLVVAFHISLITRDQLIWMPGDWDHRLTSSLLMAGASGVTLFFVLSGFLLFMPYAKSLLSASDWPSARNFYLRRAFRILPGYYVSLFLMILLFHPEYLQRDHLKQLVLFLTFFMDSSQSTYHQLNGPFWTLAVEWQYYMILPLIALAIRWIVQRGSPRARTWMLPLCVVGVIGWGLFSRYYGLYFSAHPNASFLVPRPVLHVFLFLTFGVSGKYLEDFAVGMLISVCYVFAIQIASDGRFKTFLLRLSPWLWRAGLLVLIFMALWHFNQGQFGVWPFLNKLFMYYDLYNEFLLALGFGLCVLAILFGSAATRAVFAWAPLRWLGFVSYSLYIWHLPLLVLLMRGVVDHLRGSWPRPLEYSLYWLYVLVVIIPFSLGFYVWIEKPWIQLGEKLRRRGKQKNDVPAVTR